jgi:AcrR family transcriptional regulator
MARTRDPETHAIRRDAFVDVAQGLIQSKGYEELSVQEVIDAVGASKGAFYHYFDSKADLLAAVIDRMADAVAVEWAAILERPGGTARRRLELLFQSAAQWKSARKDLVFAVLDAWLSDENAIVREKLRALIGRRMTPPLEAILREGVASGEFTIGDANGTADVIVALVTGMQERAGALFVGRQKGTVPLELVERTFAAFTEAVERILGVPAGRLQLMAPGLIDEWFR